MKIIKNTSASIDLLFSVDEVAQDHCENVDGNLIKKMFDIAKDNDIIANDIYKYNSAFVTRFKNYYIFRAYREELLKGDIDYYQLADGFATDIRRYIKEIMNGSIKLLELQEKHDKSLFVMESKSIEELKQCIVVLNIKGRASLYKHNNTYKLVFSAKRFDKAALKIKEFVDIRYYNKAVIVRLKENWKLIAKDKAVAIIKEYY